MFDNIGFVVFAYVFSIWKRKGLNLAQYCVSFRWTKLNSYLGAKMTNVRWLKKPNCFAFVS